jgi:hypothetical protein
MDMDLATSFYDEDIAYAIDTEAQQASSTIHSRRSELRLLPTSRTRSSNVKSTAVNWICMLVTVTFVFLAIDFSWHTLQPNSRHIINPAVPPPEREPFLSEHAAIVSRHSPQSMADLDQVVTKTLLKMPDIENYRDSQAVNDEKGERLLDDECTIDLHIDIICDGCEEWVAQNRLPEEPICFSELTSMTFRYTGCPCGTWYSIDYESSTWSNATGQTSLVYDCWNPTFTHNKSDIPSEITCEDQTGLTLDAADVEYNQGTAVQWVATAADDATNVVGSGTVSVGQEYTIASGDANIELPAFITVTFYDQNSNILQSTTFPSAYCPGYPDIWYRHGYSQMHIVGGQDLTSGTISTRDTVKEVLWARVTVDASQSPVPVRLQELSLVANVNADAINLTDAVNGVELNGNGEWVTVTRDDNTRSSSGRATLNHSRQQLNGEPEIMTMMVGPMTIDMYWTTRYTIFGTFIATQSNNNDVVCNGWDFQEQIAGLQ